jgi:hypothetical protein
MLPRSQARRSVGATAGTALQNAESLSQQQAQDKQQQERDLEQLSTA